MRPLALLILVAAVLVPAASAQAKADVHFSPALTTLVPGQRTTIVMRMEKVVGEDTDSPRMVAARGATPTLSLTDTSTGRTVEARGTKADSSGRSTATLTVPSAGNWRPRVEIERDAAFEMEAIYIGQTPTEAAATPSPAPATAAGGDDGFPWLPVAAIAAALAALIVLARRRLGSPPPRAA
jgi:hypothetical protein